MSVKESDVARAAQLAFILEPIPEKPGLTSRSRDLFPEVSLDKFLIGGVNIGEAFRELAIRINKSRDWPVCYDLCLKAQQESTRGRGGCRLNYGGIITMFPIVMTHCRLGTSDPIEILDGVKETLMLTNTEDTVWLQKMRNFAYSITPYKREDISPIKEDYRDIFEYYTGELKGIATRGGETSPYRYTSHAGRSNIEITKGYPYVRQMLKIRKSILDNDPSLSYIEVMERLDKIMRMKNREESPVWFADLYTCLNYLLIIENDDALK